MRQEDDRDGREESGGVVRRVQDVRIFSPKDSGKGGLLPGHAEPWVAGHTRAYDGPRFGSQLRHERFVPRGKHYLVFMSGALFAQRPQDIQKVGLPPSPAHGEGG